MEWRTKVRWCLARENQWIVRPAVVVLMMVVFWFSLPLLASVSSWGVKTFLTHTVETLKGGAK